MRQDPDRIPVIIGIGQINDRPETPEKGLDPVGLMAEALRRADADAGAGWLARCDSLAVVSQLAWPHLNPVDGALAAKLGIAPGHQEQTAKPNGDSPVRLLHEAANRIGRGEAGICAVVGGEALRTAAQLAATRDTTQPSGAPARRDALRDAPHRKRTGYAQSYGLTVPTDVYPLYENAGRSTYGQSLAEGQAESGAIWALMADVAAGNDSAWLRRRISPADIVQPGENNRMIAFPYTKLQVANASVNQGAGFIVTSLALAHARGLPGSALVHIGHGAAAREDENFLHRGRYDRSPSLEVSLERTLELNGLTSDDLTHAELYSCFPCVPKMARRVLGWPLDRPATVFGGLTFGGGPIGNYMSHAICEMVRRLRGTRDKGLLFANGGYATHNHAIILSGEPTTAAFPQSFDAQHEADERRGAIPPLDPDYLGPASIETFTVHYDRDGRPGSGVIVALTPAGTRTLAHVPGDAAGLIGLLTGEQNDPVGLAGRVVEGPDELRHWSMD